MNRKKASLIVTLLVVAGTLYFGWAIIPEGVRAGTLYVGGVGPGNYTTIQSAIDNATPGDTIYVFSGTYYENVIVNKTLNITGEDRNTTIIDGGGAGVMVNITADWVNLTGFSVTNSGGGLDGAGIVLYHVDNSYIANNTLPFNRGDGMRLSHSNNNTIAKNDVSSNFYLGIILRHSNNNSIADNTILDNVIGLLLDYSDNNTIENNDMFLNWNEGLSLEYSDGNLIANNNASGNVLGIALRHSNSTIIVNNTASSNEVYGISLFSSNKTSIINNSASSNARGPGIYLRTSEDILMKNNQMIADGIFIEGDTITHWITHAIDISNTVNGKPVYQWKNVTGGSVPSDAGQVILINCSQVNVENLNVNKGSMGIQVVFSSSVNITDNNASSNNRGGVYLYSSHGNTILNNSATDIVANMNVWSGIHLYDSNRNSIVENNVSNNGRGIKILYSNNNTVNNNTGFNTSYCITLVRSDNNTIVNNTARFHSVGIYLSFSNTNIVENNDASLGANTGVVLDYSDDNVIANNTVFETSHGIWVRNCINNTIAYNVLSSNRDWGIYFVDSDRNIVTHNTASQNSWYGGIILTRSNNNTITNNNASDNDYGIRMWESNDNTFAGNTVFLNRVWGFHFFSSHANVMYHNSFISNLQQAFDDTDTNKWDDGYPSGGNYWSDYNGIDNCSGPNQDICPNSDGIGDTPYIIDADSEDRYPLMLPIGMIFPRPPRMLQASISGRGLENVTLKWYLSLDDGMGLKSVIGYNIYRSKTFDFNGKDYQPIASLPNGTSEFVDNTAGEGNPNNYFYQVCAVDFGNNTTCAENQAGKFTRPLLEGTNLVSAPLIQSNESIENVLQTVEFDKSWTYDATDVRKPWKWYMTFKPYKGDLRSMNETEGFWVNVTEDCNFTVAGIVPVQTIIHLSKGWNLVGFPSFQQDYTVGDLKAETGATRVEGFDPAAPPYFLRALQPTDILQAGYGYWLKATSDTIWTVNNT
ncbi:MAG: hypothetical protein E3J35_06120 [Methanomassiliicoccales archaeon]|nr:MAG: hypothetical protein E3J35_06120 [Methanomassiliicoccales archaeon]